MVKPKARQSVENDDDGEDDSQLLPRTRQRTKVQSAKHEDSSTEENDGEEAVPAPKVKPSPKARRVANASESPSNSTEVPDTSIARKRKGGNKRRFTHEYCLTCRHYGRACSGRRDGQDGCSVCRDPNREKGEKLRECLWANPELGVYTYEEARVVHKEAQIERRAREKAKSREQRANANASNKAALKVTIAHGPPPPVTRQLDVVPPPSATFRPQNSYVPPLLKHQNDDIDTITVDTATVAHSPPMSYLPSMNGEPGPKIHRPTVIKLRLKNPSDRESVEASSIHQPSPSQPSQPSQPIQPIQQLPVSSRPLSFVPPPIPRGPPYYDITIQAWRFPSQPGTYLAPSDIPTAAYPVYESPYGHPPAFTTASPNAVLPSPNGSASAPKMDHIMTRPLDKSGIPCKKWARTGSNAPTISGSSTKLKRWKSDTAEADRNADEKRDDVSTSDLSSVIDVDDPNEFDKAVRDSGSQESPDMSTLSHSVIVKDDPEYVMVHNDAGDETPEEEGDEEEDRLQAQINRMVRENAKKAATHTHVPSPLEIQAPRHAIPRPSSKPTANSLPTSMSKRPGSFTTVNGRAQNTNDNDEDSGTDDEGPLKRLPPEIRSKLSRTATTHIRISETETITIRPEHFKKEILRARSTSHSADGESTDLQFRAERKHRGQAKREIKRSGHNSSRGNRSSAVRNEDEDEEEEEDENVRSDGQDVDMTDA